MNHSPWLDYEGQTTAELLAAKTTHRIDSILCAFEWGIQAKARLQGEKSLTSEEQLVVALMALDREVNNGGYHQFFANSSRRFAPVVVDCLRRIDAQATAAITEKAIAELSLSTVTAEFVSAAILQIPASDKILNECDKEFYRIEEIADKLFPFVEEHQDRIQLIPGTQPPRRLPHQRPTASTRLHSHLLLRKVENRSLDSLRNIAREIASKNDIPATDQDIEGVAVLNALERSLRARDLTSSESLATLAFELMRDDPTHCVAHREYVKQLLEAGRVRSAEAETLVYLAYLKTCDQSTLSTQNHVLYWASLLQEESARLPKAVDFFRKSFPEENLNEPLPRQRFTAKEIRHK